MVSKLATAFLIYLTTIHKLEYFSNKRAVWNESKLATAFLIYLTRIYELEYFSNKRAVWNESNLTKIVHANEEPYRATS
jgi:hypothetical protein